MSQSEIYATLIENNLRAEQGLPLRTYYSQDGDGNPMYENRIIDSKKRSLYFNTGNTTPSGNSYPKTITAENRYLYRKQKNKIYVNVDKNLMIVTVFASCLSKLQVNKDKESVINIVNTIHQRNTGIKKGPFLFYVKFLYSVREKAAQLFRIETNTSQINTIGSQKIGPNMLLSFFTSYCCWV